MITEEKLTEWEALPFHNDSAWADATFQLINEVRRLREENEKLRTELELAKGIMHLGKITGHPIKNP